MFDDLAHAADLSSARDGVVVDDAEAEVGMKEPMHHDAVAELEDLEGEDRTGEEDQREREESELQCIVGGCFSDDAEHWIKGINCSQIVIVFYLRNWYKELFSFLLK